MLMPDPATGLSDIELLLDVPCPDWACHMEPRGVQLDCDGVAAGQAALRVALAGGGTYHDVLGRTQHVLRSSGLESRQRRVALAVLDVARSQSRHRLAMALSGA